LTFGPPGIAFSFFPAAGIFRADAALAATPGFGMNSQALALVILQTA
jgi:hypothetical protein